MQLFPQACTTNLTLTSENGLLPTFTSSLVLQVGYLFHPAFALLEQGDVFNYHCSRRISAEAISPCKVQRGALWYLFNIHSPVQTRLKPLKDHPAWINSALISWKEWPWHFPILLFQEDVLLMEKQPLRCCTNATETKDFHQIFDELMQNKTAHTKTLSRTFSQ